MELLSANFDFCISKCQTMKKTNILFTLLLLLSFPLAVVAQDGYEIKVAIDKFEAEEMYLGYFYGENQYIKDTLRTNEGKYFIFKGEEKLPGGVYMIIIPPNNEFVQILIDDEDQHFTIEGSMDDLVERTKITGSDDNERYYEYLKYLNKIRPQQSLLREKKTGMVEREMPTDEIDKGLKELDDKVFSYQDDIIKKYPSSLTALLIKATKEIDVPEFEGTTEEVGTKQYLFFKNNYFENVDLSDPRMIRTPIVHSRVDYYVNNLTAKHPDSISQSVDYILNGFSEKSDGYKYYLIHFLNKYASSKIVGMDGVYVHLVDKYYAKGVAPWIEMDDLNKMKRNANTLRPILIGKTAPDIKMYLEDSTTINLHDLNSKYTVMFFWDPNCGHCKKSIPVLIDMYEKMKARGVEVFAVCTKTGSEAGECWDLVKEKDMGRWINVNDPLISSRYKITYDVQRTPQIFVLDENKKIISKKIGAAQIEQVIDYYEHRQKLEDAKSQK